MPFTSNRPSGRPTATPSTSHEEFGTLGDLCMSHSPNERPELFGECTPIGLGRKRKPTDPAEAMDMLSLTRSH